MSNDYYVQMRKWTMDISLKCKEITTLTLVSWYFLNQTQDYQHTIVEVAKSEN